MSDGQGHLPRLSPADERLLDALVQCDFDLGALSLSDDEHQRAEAIVGLLSLLDDYPVNDSDDTLIDATLARINSYERDRVARMNIDAESVGSASSLRSRIPDFVTIAAVLLLGASIVIPVMHELRQRSIDTACANNLRMMGYAFGNYAADNDGRLPVAQAGLHSQWSRFVDNMVNLAPLVSGGYCQQGHLDCPGHEGPPASSYSYQWQMPGSPTLWDSGRNRVTLGDRNPVIDALRAGDWMSPFALSLNHGGRGQNVLVSDGSTMWLVQPVIGGGDNIWMPEGIDRLEEGVQPASVNDVFLAH